MGNKDKRGGWGLRQLRSESREFECSGCVDHAKAMLRQLQGLQGLATATAGTLSLNMI